MTKKNKQNTTYQPVEVSESRSVDLDSHISGRSYRLLISHPTHFDDTTQRPVLVVLDGDAYFHFITEVTRNRGTLGNEIEAPIVVGVSFAHQGKDAWHQRRYEEYTPCAPAKGEMPAEFVDALNFAGLNTFVDFLQTDVIKTLKSICKTNLGELCLFGHSIAGLAVIETLFHPASQFTRFIAVSPALWWNEHQIMSKAHSRLRDISESHNLTLYISVGELEETPPTAAPEGSVLSQEELAEIVAKCKMVNNAKEFSRITSANTNINCQMTVSPQQTHISVPYQTIVEALNFSFPNKKH